MRHTMTFLAALAALAGATTLYSQTPDSFNPGANSTVFCLTPQLDGRILAGGDFTTLAGQVRYRIGRLHADGLLDADFNVISSNSYPTVQAMAVQADGKTLVGGKFTILSGQPRKRIARLNTDGTVDLDFNPGASYTPDASSEVKCLAVQPDGKILVGGVFRTLGGLVPGRQ